VSLVEQALAGLKDRAVLVVGAGQAGRQALSRLAKAQTGALLVASRSRRHASEAADKHGAEVVPLENVASTLNRVDAVIAASQAPAHILTAADYLAARVNRPHFLVDLSVPRAIDPALAEVPGVTLRTVDDLGDIVRASTSRRLAEVPRVETIVLDEARRAYGQFRERVGRRGVQAGLA
jgi:glutamyl-tRNA reductase